MSARPTPKALISMAEATAHLRVDTDADSAELQIKIYAASAAVLGYLKSRAEEFLDTAGEVVQDTAGNPIVPYQVYAATCLMLGYLYKNRDNSEDFQQGYLPPAVTALLYTSRDPALL